MEKQENITDDEIILQKSKTAERSQCIQNKIKLQIEEIMKTKNLIYKFQEILADQKNMLAKLREELKMVLPENEINQFISSIDNVELADETEDTVLLNDDDDDDIQLDQSNTTRRENLKRKAPHEPIENQTQKKICGISGRRSLEEPIFSLDLKADYLEIFNYIKDSDIEKDGIIELLQRYHDIYFKKDLKCPRYKKIAVLKEKLNVPGIEDNVYEEVVDMIETVRKSNDEIALEIESTLIKSQCDEEVDFKNDYNFQNSIACINAIKELYNVISNTRLKQLHVYALMGQGLEKLKKMRSKSYLELLREHKIEYTKGYVNFLIRFSKIVKVHPRILNFSVSIHFIKKNLKIIQHLARKNKW